ncbi:LD-carboxypeptidase [Acidaminobacter sp. JC074]|uniref:S66 peptidase family protein n=1 Tax=Acidaminobacter sp. JC074 TaxID=2530199 RepID=UPI001F0DC850|nr:LD-carboxypeptidase [Acidaminobacter sp. JC074]MCH4887447.1 LD-carboxypeptidase [Acidaminobacter sp. JC074]
MIKARKLKQGDKVAVIAPSSPASQSQLDNVKAYMEKLNLEYDMLPSCFKSHGHFAGRDDIRLNDLHEAFKNDSYKGIICLKGGYGTPRLLKNIDYDLIKNNPKVFVGFSDITGLHTAIQKMTGLVTFHGPMAISNMDDFSLLSLKNQIFDGMLGPIENPPKESIESFVKGRAQGILVGGNLSLLVSTLGSPYEIDTKGKILFIEEVGEASYRVDRMLTSLMLAGKFDDANGIVLGTFSQCEPEVVIGKKTDLDLITIFQEIIGPFNKATIMNVRAGHNYPQVTLPFGLHVEIDEDQLIILEEGVK